MAHSTWYVIAFSAGRVFYMSEARRDMTDAEIEERARWWSQEVAATHARLVSSDTETDVQDRIDGYSAGAMLERDALQLSDILQRKQDTIEDLQHRLLACSEVG